MKIQPTKIPGCFEIIPNIFTDDRGSFVKTFHRDLIEQQGLEVEWREENAGMTEEMMGYMETTTRGLMK